jgi:PBSX family phage terminase large subunit
VTLAPPLQEKQDAKNARILALSDPRNKPYRPQGIMVDAFYDHSPEVMLTGPAGTGKTRCALEKLHLVASKYPGMRGLMVRKTRESLTQSAMVTFEKFVIPENGTVKFRTAEQEYRYVNGSVIALGGMDKASKIMSSEYDVIYVPEATELEEEDWEVLITRNRYGVMPYNQVIGDCNPSFPKHWIRQRIDSARKISEIVTRHEDNPTLWDIRAKGWTRKGSDYISKLDGLTGVRYLRLRKGIWAATEGMIYDEWDDKIHLCNHFAPPKEWERIWIVDFGFTNPFVWQAWAIDPENDVGYMFSEIYKTKLLVEDASALIKTWVRSEHERMPSAIVCDWDAEGRATLERHLEMQTTPANKDVLNGIQSVKTRMKHKGEEKPHLIIMRDALQEVDPDLQDARKPLRTEYEIEGYAWDDNKKKEAPIKIDDHGCDCIRYFSRHLEDNTLNWSRGM